MATRPRFVFFGTTNQLSLSAFEWLLASGCAPLAVVVTAETAASPGDAPFEQLFPIASVSQLPVLNRFHEPSLIQAAWSAAVPLYAWRQGGYREIRQWMTRMRPDAACVVCFPRRIPLELISLPPAGFLNVHPSLLPHYRGPAPLFWLFQKDDLAHRGLTVHQMDEGLDTGPLVRQEPISFAQGLGQAMIEHQCGQTGGRLLLEAMALLSSGGQATPQTGRGSYHPWPAAADYELKISWPASRAFNFMRGSNGSGMPYPLTLAGRRLALIEALDVNPIGRQDPPLMLDGSIARVQFASGILTARLRLS